MRQLSASWYKGFPLMVIGWMVIVALGIDGATIQKKVKTTRVSYQHLDTIKLDADIDPNSFSVDRQGNIYVVSANNGPAMVLDKLAPSGQRLRRFDFSQVLGTAEVSIYHLFLARNGTLYVLAVWASPSEQENVLGVLAYDRDGRFQRVVRLEPQDIQPVSYAPFAVDSTGNFYLVGFYFKDGRPSSGLVSDNAVHKFSSSGRLLASFSPLRKPFDVDASLNDRTYQALLIDGRDRLYHIDHEGTLIRAYDVNGKLIKEYQVKSVPGPSPVDPQPQGTVSKQRCLGACVWEDRIVLSFAQADRASGGMQAHILVVDLMQGTEVGTTLAQGAVPPTVMGLDGYAYSAAHISDQRTNAAFHGILKHRLIME